MKYLVRWKLLLGPAQLRRLSSKIGLLQVGLNYIRELVDKGRVIGVYRFVREEPQMRAMLPSGIAIVEAESIEEIERSLEELPGLTVEGVRGLNYIEYEIEPLIELPYAREKEV